MILILLIVATATGLGVGIWATDSVKNAQVQFYKSEYNMWRDRWLKSNEHNKHLERRITSLKGAITKLKRRRPIK